MLKSGFVESQGIKIHYVMHKQSPEKISLVFVPGIMMSGEIWEKQLKYFAPHYTVVAIDPRSHGRSEQATEGHYARALAKDIDAVINTLNLQHVIVIGWSLGVPQVLNYAHHFGAKRTKALVLVDGIVGLDPTVSFYQTMIDLWAEFQTDRLVYTEKFIKNIFKKPQEEAYINKLKDIALKMPTNTVMTLINNYILQDFRPLLPGVKIPTWIATVQGPRLSYMQEMASLLTSAQLEIFQEAGHALFVEQPEKFNHSLEEFIENLGFR